MLNPGNPLVQSSSLEERRGDRWGGNDGTMFGEFTPQHVVRGWSEIVTILPFRLHLLLAEYNPTFPCNPELLSSHIGLRLLEINLDLLSTLLFLLPLLEPTTIVTWWQAMWSTVLKQSWGMASVSNLHF